MALAMLAGYAYAQVVEITPPPTESPSSKLAPGTQWVYWMAIGAGVIVVLILLAVAVGYLRFAPKFFGREVGARTVPPGTRPPTLARQAAQMRYTPPPPAEHAAAPAQAPVQAPAPSEAPASAPQPAAAPQPSAVHSGSGGMDQDTFDRVLKEQLDRGVDRRVAEGRARAAAVVAARKKAQG